MRCQFYIHWNKNLVLKSILKFLSDYMSVLYPQSPWYFARQHSARVLQTLRSFYLSHVTAAGT